MSSFEHALLDSVGAADFDASQLSDTWDRREAWQMLINEVLGRAPEMYPEWIWDLPLLAQQTSIQLCLAPSGTLANPAWRTYLSAELSEEQWASLREYNEKFRDAMSAMLADPDVRHLQDIRGLSSPLIDFEDTYWNRLVADEAQLERDYLSQWPVHFSIPVAPLGEVFDAPVHVISDRGTIASVTETTNRMLVQLAERHGDLIEIADATTTVMNTSFTRGVAQLEETANLFLEMTGPHFFTLALELKSPSEWFVGEVPEWTATVDLRSISIGRLSSAELRWALASLQWALSGLDDSRPQILIIDEPERGLHRMREWQLPHMLNALRRSSTNLMVLAASHAPSFLDVRVDAALHHVSRLRGYPTVLRPVDLGTSSLTSETATNLGLSPSDLLQLTRVFVLVEGIHDEIVINRLIGGDIRRAGGRVLPINGAAHARSIADARILFDATDASVVFVVDNVNGPRALETWNTATGYYLAGKHKQARAALAGLLRLGAGGELVWLHALGERAIDSRVLHRIHPFGLKKRDIICYLPTSRFLPGEATWDQLEVQYDEARAAGLTRDDFKSWLRNARGGSFSRGDVSDAAEAVDEVPSEFGELALKVQELALLGGQDKLWDQNS
ncbi:hypothetical protein [Pseudarthrobacter sp. efr-133-R2A-89]|uniref:ATP-dependent nuclease n=1 Tax=Pseudarthrobacter sp. efr-133-R2A-89 TaxID=3040302 RepID=UPI002556404E|nr:hypothetical protein [Pseudarthrobacter sp. efr-133-R2A-89]